MCMCVSICICVPASICNKICNELQARKRIFECNLFYFNAFIFISSLIRPVFLWHIFIAHLHARPTQRDTNTVYTGITIKICLAWGGRGAEREEVAGLMQLQAAGYDMFISVCVSFLMIFNYARDSYFTRAIKRSILYSAFRCRQQHAAPRPSGRSGNTGSSGNSGTSFLPELDCTRSERKLKLQQHHRVENLSNGQKDNSLRA